LRGKVAGGPDVLAKERCPHSAYCWHKGWLLNAAGPERIEGSYRVP